jgi:hypothetical protein
MNDDDSMVVVVSCHGEDFVPKMMKRWQVRKVLEVERVVEDTGGG